MQDSVPVAEPPPIGFHHMFGNKEAEVQVLENVCGQLVEDYSCNEVGALGRNKLQIIKALLEKIVTRSTQNQQSVAWPTSMDIDMGPAPARLTGA